MRKGVAKRPRSLTAAPATGRTCPICFGVFASLDRHHIVPQATQKASLKEEYGEGPTLDLCATCHGNLHKSALAVLAGNGKTYFTPEQEARAKRYVNIIAVCLQRDKDLQQAASSVQSTQIKKMTIALTQAEIAALDVYKLDNGFSSRDAAVRHILRRALLT